MSSRFQFKVEIKKMENSEEVKELLTLCMCSGDLHEAKLGCETSSRAYLQVQGCFTNNELKITYKDITVRYTLELAGFYTQALSLLEYSVMILLELTVEQEGCMERFLRWSTALLNLKTDCDTGFDFSANFVHLIYLCQEFQKACSKEEPDWVDKFEAAVVAISNTAYPIKTALDCGSLGLLMGSNSEMTVAIQLMCLRGEVPTGKYLEKRINAIMTKGLLLPKQKTTDAAEATKKQNESKN